jgi:hypothetical protein
MESDTTELSPDEIIHIITTTVQPTLYDTYPSPDGKWRAEVTLYNEDCIPSSAGGLSENGYDQLTLVNLEDGSQEIADSQLINCGGMGGYGFAGLFWSSNSRYFYYTNARAGGPGDGCGYPSQSILRLEAVTLKSEALGGGPRSPDATKFATWMVKEILVWDIDQGDIAHLPVLIPNAPWSGIAWSPDGKSLAYLQLETGCPFGKSYLVHANIATGEQTLLKESDKPTFIDVKWDNPGQLTLFDENHTKWLYDLSAGTLEQAP